MDTAQMMAIYKALMLIIRLWPKIADMLEGNRKTLTREEVIQEAAKVWKPYEKTWEEFEEKAEEIRNKDKEGE